MSKDIQSTRFPGALRQAVKEALEFGWTAKQGGSGWKLRSPGGTEWIHVTPGSNIPDNIARDLRSKIAKAALTESTPQADDFRQKLEDPKDANGTVTCAECDTEFMTVAGFNGHEEGCRRRTRARLEAEQEASGPVVLVGDERPPEGHTEPAEPSVVEVSETPASSKMGNKEEDMTDSTKPPRKGYRWHVVKPGLARALYTAMMARSRHKGEATSTYANVIAEMVEESGYSVEMPPELTEAEEKLDQIIGLLGVDVEALAGVDRLREENERLTGNLRDLRELLNGI